MEKLIDFFKDKHVDTVLDVGTGTGNFIAVLKTVLSKSKITGVDPDKGALSVALNKYPDVVFGEMSGEKLLFDDNSFTLASISMALHHLPNVNTTLLEMKRVLKPGAWIIVSELFSNDLNPAQEVHKQYHHFRSASDRIKGICHNPAFTRNEIIDLIIKAGIEIRLQFVFEKVGSLLNKPEDLNEYISKMEAMLETVKHSPEYEQLKPQIADFSEKAKQFGLQAPPRLVVVGRVKN